MALGALGLWDGVRVVQTQRHNLDAAISGGWIAAVGGLLVVLSLVQAVRAWKGAAAPATPLRAVFADLARPLRVAALMAAYALLFPRLGYFLSTALFACAYLRLFGSYRWWSCVVIALAFAASTSWLFAALRLQLPRGVLPWP